MWGVESRHLVRGEMDSTTRGATGDVAVAGHHGTFIDIHAYDTSHRTERREE